MAKEDDTILLTKSLDKDLIVIKTNERDLNNQTSGSILSSTNKLIFYNKYIPVNYKPPSQQIIIHRYPTLPSKPRPIMIEQRLPNKPSSKHITYHHVNPNEFIQNETERKYHRYIEYKKPHITIEVEIIRLPIIKLNPEEYQNKSNELTQIDNIRLLIQDPNILHWRI